MQLNKTTGTIFWMLIGLLFFIPFNGNVHLFDWDEINFAEIAREMLVKHTYLQPTINFENFTEKPPLYFWIQSLSMKIFGINEFAARFPNALLGAIVLPFLFRLGTKLRSTSLGMFWALAYFGSVLPSLYFKSGIIDPYFNFFIFTSIYFIAKAALQKQQSKKYKANLIFAAILTTLAILTKGPVALLIIGICIVTYFIAKKFVWFLSILDFLLYGTATIFFTSIWFLLSYFQTGNKFIIEFTIRQWQLLTTADAGHGGFFLYHFVVIFFGCFPAIAFMLASFFNKEKSNTSVADFKKWMSILFWVVLILFTLVSTKIVHYSSLCYYPLTFLAAVAIDNLFTNSWKYKRWITVVTCIAALPFIIAPLLLAYFSQRMYLLKSFLKEDVFASENMDAAIHWTGYEFLPTIIMLIAVALFITFVIKKNILKAILSIFIGTIIWLQLGLFFYIKNVEAISQRANIEFWQSKQNEDCYFTTFGYKSYAHFFYGAIKPQQNKNTTNEDWLLKGNIDKPLYFSCKANDYAECIAQIKDAIFLYSKNGFYFFIRKPK